VSITQAGVAIVSSVDKTAIDAPYPAGTYTIAITSNARWNAIINSGAGAAWCTVSPTAADGNGTVTVTLLRNAATNTRAATVTVISGISHHVAVTQATCPNCAVWTTCSGFTEVSSVQYENRMIWSDANTLCQNKAPGWRLPTYDEFQCMCAYGERDNIPGGAAPGNMYWTSTPGGYGYYTGGFNPACASYGTYAASVSLYVKCVK
jgi:hypothetical protein